MDRENRRKGIYKFSESRYNKPVNMRRAQGDAVAYRNREIVSVFTPRQNGKACRIPTKSSPFFRCSHHRKILCYVRMETVRIPMRAVFRFQVIKTFITKREASSPFSRNNSKRSPLYSLCRSGHDRLYSKRVRMLIPYHAASDTVNGIKPHGKRRGEAHDKLCNEPHGRLYGK